MESKIYLKKEGLQQRGSVIHKMFLNFGSTLSFLGFPFSLLLFHFRGSTFINSFDIAFYYSLVVACSSDGLFVSVALR